MIALLATQDPEYVNEAATRGVFAYIVDGGHAAEELQSTLAITLRRFAEYRNLQGAFGRRATIEHAKGILMARHAIDQNKAFEIAIKLRQQAGLPREPTGLVADLQAATKRVTLCRWVCGRRGCPRSTCRAPRMAGGSERGAVVVADPAAVRPKLAEAAT